MHEVLTWPVGRDVEGKADPERPSLAPLLSYLGAATLGGAVTALLIGATGLVIRESLELAHSTIFLGLIPLVWLSLVCQRAGRIDPLPERRAQVPTRWLQWSSRGRVALAFGLMIGSGGLTYLKHAAAWTLAAIVVLAPTIAAGMLVGAIYGAARSAPLAVTWRVDRASRPRPDWRSVGAVDGLLSRALVFVGGASFLSIGMLYGM